MRIHSTSFRHRYRSYNHVCEIATADSANARQFTSSGNYSRWDRFGRTLSEKWQQYSGSTVFDQVDYAYDASSNRTKRDVRVDQITGSFPDERDQVFEYDDLHRLTNVEQGTDAGQDGDIDPLKFEQNWSLDQMGNWGGFKQDNDGGGWNLEHTRVHNDVNELDNDNIHNSTPGDVFVTTTGPDWATPVIYDANGNMTQFPQPAALTSAYTAKYDAWNRMVEVKSGGTVVLTNEYDGLGRRIVKDVNAGGTTDDRDYYYNEDWQLLTEVKNGSVEAIYQWHPYYVDALAVRMHANDDIHYFLHDANFNVTAVVDDATDLVVERYSYTPYGEVTFLDEDFDEIGSSAIANVHLYTGRERDPETGLQLNRHRFYHAQLGRWVTRDPIGYEGSQWNLYEYGASTPLNIVDPNGMSLQNILVGCFGGGVVGGIGGGVGGLLTGGWQGAKCGALGGATAGCITGAVCTTFPNLCGYAACIGGAVGSAVEQGCNGSFDPTDPCSIMGLFGGTIAGCIGGGSGRYDEEIIQFLTGMDMSILNNLCNKCEDLL